MQKTAYELRIRDWSSDVCSSDLGGPARDLPERCCASPPEARHRFFCLQAIHSTVVPGLVPGTHWHWCKAMAYCIYILANRKHGTLYIGITNDVARRIWEHRQGLGRSEEHTSELQSLMRISYAVFCLKKKTKTRQSNDNKS